MLSVDYKNLGTFFEYNLKYITIIDTFEWGNKLHQKSFHSLIENTETIQGFDGEGKRLFFSVQKMLKLNSPEITCLSNTLQ